MKKHNQKRKTNYKKIIFNNTILDKITDSSTLNEKEKISFLKYVGYLTREETKQLSQLI